jgi:site-specific recombinase XerD
MIPLNQTAVGILSKRKNLSNSNLVFTINGCRIQQDYIIHHFKKYIRKAGLRDELHFHSLRHTFATRLVQKGVSIYKVSKLLGHADVKTTQIYASLMLYDLQNTVTLLDDVR